MSSKRSQQLGNKQTIMKEFLKDLEKLCTNLTLWTIVGVLLLLKYYPDIKSGIIDAWLNK